VRLGASSSSQARVTLRIEEKMKLEIFFLVLCLFGPTLSADEDYDASSRNPYEYQFSVDDPETLNRYEIEESGNPDIVKGSYQIALPDGRTQLVTYEVHPEKGYQAKVTYSGTAQYPDTPDYVPSAYGPPEPIRPGFSKFKRQSKVEDVKQIIFGKHKKKIGKKVVTQKKENKKAKSQVNVQDESPSNQSIKKKVETVDHSVTEKVDLNNFDDTEHSPQAEPLSLQQSAPQRNKKIERPNEYKPSYTTSFINQNDDRQPRSNDNKRRTKTQVNKQKYDSVDLLTASSKTEYFPIEDQNKHQEIQTEKQNTLDVIYFIPQTVPSLNILERQEEKSTQYFISKPETQTQSIEKKENYQEESASAKANDAAIQTLTTTTEKPTLPSASLKTVTPSPLSGLTIHEAVPATKITEAPEVYHIDISGYNGQEFASPRDAFEELADAVFSEKTPKKRKIDVKDYDKSVSKQEISNPSFFNTESFPPKLAPISSPPPATSTNLLPTIYRSQIKFIKTTEAGTKNEKFVPTSKQHPVDISYANDVKREHSQQVEQGKVQGEQELTVTYGSNLNLDDQEKILETIFYLPTVTPVEAEENKHQAQHQHQEKTSHEDQDLTVSYVEKSSEDETEKLLNTIFFVPVETAVNKETTLVPQKSSEETIQITSLYQTKFKEDPEITTRRPHYKIIRKSRVPKEVTFSPSREYKPVHRNEKVKLVYKKEGFVPEYIPRF